MRRKGQSGNVFQKEGSKKRRKSDPWLPDKPAYLQFWEDVPGESDSRRKSVIPLGVCRTRTIAERKGVEKIEQLGINSARRFIEVTNAIHSNRQQSTPGAMPSTNGFTPSSRERSWPT
jgi:hypothetical protein